MLCTLVSDEFTIPFVCDISIPYFYVCFSEKVVEEPYQ